MKRLWASALAALLLVSAPAALANTAPIEVDVAADWHHDLSGVTFPVELGGFRRDDIEDFGSKRLDIAGTYQQQATHTTATLYVFRAGLVDASIWHDRILDVIAAGPFGPLDRAHALATPFAPPGAKIASGYRSALTSQGGKVTSTGIAIFPHDDWLVAVRMTSRELPQDGLDKVLTGFVGALAVPAPKRESPAAYLIQFCTTNLPTAEAPRAKPDMAATILAGALINATQKKAGKQRPGKAAPAVPYCKDATSTADFGAYWDGRPRDGFIVATGDAGVAAIVAPDTIGALLDTSGAHAGAFGLTLSTVDLTLTFTGFDALPSVSQVVEAITRDAPTSSVSREDNGNTTIALPEK